NSTARVFNQVFADLSSLLPTENDASGSRQSRSVTRTSNSATFAPLVSGTIAVSSSSNGSPTGSGNPSISWTVGAQHVLEDTLQQPRVVDTGLQYSSLEIEVAPKVVLVSSGVPQWR